MGEQRQGGSGQDVAEDWQSTALEVARLLQEGADDFLQQPPVNVERLDPAHIQQSQAWQYLTALLVLFAERRGVFEQDGIPEPPVKKLKTIEISMKIAVNSG